MVSYDAGMYMKSSVVVSQILLIILRFDDFDGFEFLLYSVP